MIYVEGYRRFSRLFAQTSIACALCARRTVSSAVIYWNTFSWSVAYPMSETFGGARPKVTNQSMRLSEGEPCGEECFRLTDDSYLVVITVEYTRNVHS